MNTAGLARGRRAAESLMTLTLAVYTPNGTTTVDGIKTQVYASGTATVGKVQGASDSADDTATRMVTVGGVPRPVLEGGLHVPISAAVPKAGDRGVGWEYVVTAVGAADPALLNRRYLVVDVPAKSFATARRLDVVQVPW